MSLVGFIKSLYYRAARSWLERRLSRQAPSISLDRSNWGRSLQEPTAFYFECVRFFHKQLPSGLRAHRVYFHNVSGNRRSFGENAFHTMWYLLLEEFKPANFLEIGVFRGQIISLAALWAKLRCVHCQVYGISPFSSSGDSVSRYPANIDYYQDTLSNFDHFSLPPPRLLRAFSTDREALDLIGLTAWDMIYIDGNHDYEVARQDWEACAHCIKPGGVIVLDDAALKTSFRPPSFAGSRGHPGPSRVADEINSKDFREILQVGHNRAFQKVA